MAGVGGQRERLLEAAMRLMLAKGYWGTTVDEVCREAGVTKGSFYHYFDSKEALALALVDYYFERIGAGLFAAEERASRPPLERLGAFLSHAVALSHSPAVQEGCILGIFTLELSQTSSRVRDEIAQRFEELSGWVAALFREVEAEQPLPASPEALAREFVAVLASGQSLQNAHPDWVSRQAGSGHVL